MIAKKKVKSTVLPTQSETIGLWGNGNGVYCSKLLKADFIKQIGNKIRFCLVHNPQHKKGDNRPRFLLRAYNLEAEKADVLAAEIDLCVRDGSVEKQEVIGIDDATEIAIRLARDVRNGYSIDDIAAEAFGEMREHSFEAVNTELLEDWKWQEEQSK